MTWDTNLSLPAPPAVLAGQRPPIDFHSGIRELGELRVTAPEIVVQLTGREGIVRMKRLCTNEDDDVVRTKQSACARTTSYGCCSILRLLLLAGTAAEPDAAMRDGLRRRGEGLDPSRRQGGRRGGGPSHGAGERKRERESAKGAIC